MLKRLVVPLSILGGALLALIVAMGMGGIDW